MTERIPRLSRTTVPPAAREVGIGLVVFAIYSAVAALPSGGREEAAARHGRAVFSLERALHLDVERGLNHSLAAANPLWRTLANYEYAITYLVSAFTLLVWLYRRHSERYRVARNSFILINLVGAACFALYPVMPPRLAEGTGFVDTVRTGGTWGSWGSPLVDHADQLAAMPSLHMAWALWVGVELARLSARRSVQGLSAVHILVTLYVIMATANHYLLDAVGGAVLVWGCVWVAERGSRPARVPAADAFFLAVESPSAPQHVGGLILVDTSGGAVTRAELVAAVTARLEDLPRLTQRLSAPSRWRRPRWEPHPALDWDWHVTVRRAAAPETATGLAVAGLAGAGGTAAVAGERALPDAAELAGVAAVVAELQAEPLPRDRPLWRLVLVPDVAPDRAAVIFLMHHVVADGIGVITHAVDLMEPPLPPLEGVAGRPGPLRRAAAVAVGIAQLAVAGRQDVRLPWSGRAERRFGAVALPFERVREVARAHRAWVSDVVLCAVAGGLRRVADLPAARGARCRVTVPLMLRGPQTPPEGNYTAAVMVDLPVGEMPEADRLAEISRATGRLRSPTRALAARFVMERVGAVLPAPLHTWFARTVYGRRTFQAVVSNLPGPSGLHKLAGAPVTEVFPLLPLGPGAPQAIGALSGAGVLGFGFCTDPALADAAELATAAQDVIDELWGSADPRPGPATYHGAGGADG